MGKNYLKNQRDFLKNKYSTPKNRTQSSQATSKKLKAKYDDFFKSNHQFMDKIYGQIHKDVMKHGRNRSNSNDKSILIIEDDESEFSEELEFKKEVMKHY